MYKSTLHSNWADFFNENEIKFAYQAIYKSENGKGVLPDFYLPNTRLRNSEEKGVFLLINEKEHTIKNFDGMDINLVEFIGNPVFNMFNERNGNNGIQHAPFWDNFLAFRICEKCNSSKIDFLDNNNDYCNDCAKEFCKTTKAQKFIIGSIKKELEESDKYWQTSSFRHSVWFSPILGHFLYNDLILGSDIIQPLIDNKTLKLKGIENHQGEKMIRYVL
jgi:hypothetical protein